MRPQDDAGRRTQRRRHPPTTHGPSRSTACPAELPPYRLGSPGPFISCPTGPHHVAARARPIAASSRHRPRNRRGRRRAASGTFWRPPGHTYAGFGRPHWLGALVRARDLPSDRHTSPPPLPLTTAPCSLGRGSPASMRAGGYDSTTPYNTLSSLSPSSSPENPTVTMLTVGSPPPAAPPLPAGVVTPPPALPSPSSSPFHRPLLLRQ
jgi:hypothetical protein